MNIKRVVDAIDETITEILSCCNGLQKNRLTRQETFGMLEKLADLRKQYASTRDSHDENESLVKFDEAITSVTERI